jgi:hypothetical protein
MQFRIAFRPRTRTIPNASTNPNRPSTLGFTSSTSCGLSPKKALTTIAMNQLTVGASGATWPYISSIHLVPIPAPLSKTVGTSSRKTTSHRSHVATTKHAHTRAYRKKSHATGRSARTGGPVCPRVGPASRGRWTGSLSNHAAETGPRGDRPTCGLPWKECRHSIHSVQTTYFYKDPRSSLADLRHRRSAQAAKFFLARPWLRSWGRQGAQGADSEGPGNGGQSPQRKD